MLPLQNHLIKTLAIAANVGLASLLPLTRGEHGADSSAFAYLCVCSVSEIFFLYLHALSLITDTTYLFLQGYFWTRTSR